MLGLPLLLEIFMLFCDDDGSGGGRATDGLKCDVEDEADGVLDDVFGRGGF